MSSPAAGDPPPWWDAAFGALYPAVYAHRDDACAQREAEWAAAAAGIAQGDLVLDAGCGGGRHARALAAAGFRVVGVDRSAALLATAASLGGGPRYVRADFRALPFRGAFRCVFSFFTSFGYFDDAGNSAHLRALRAALRPGGRLVLDFLNAPRVAATLEPESERTAARLRLVEHRAIRRGRVEKSVEVFEDGALAARWKESVRLYDREALTAMLAASGLHAARVSGDLAGEAWTPASPRLVIVAEAR